MPRKSETRINEKRRALKRGEILAMHPEAIRRDAPGAFFFMFGPSTAPNDRVGKDDGVAVVNIRGPLDQFDDCWGDNYEAVVERVREAFTGKDNAKRIMREREMMYWRGEVEELDRTPVDEVPPSVVVLRMSSPGGVVAGLWETVDKIKALREAHGIPLIAYADEMAASAAYALACACDEIYLPRSGVLGSIGVISHMFSIARANDEDGVDVEVIASGDQKADGNENLPITDEAKARETARVMKLARQFFQVAASARGISPDEIEGFQAGIFIGTDAEKASLADGVMGWDAFLGEISLAYNESSVKDSRVAQDGPIGTSARGADMTALLALIERTKKDLAKATGAKKKELSAKLSHLSASLAELRAYKKTTKKMEETKEESEDDPEDKESEDDEKDKDASDDEDAESDDKDEDAESDDEDKDAESDEKDEDAEDDEKKKDAESDEKDDEALLASIVDPKRRGQLAARLGEAKAGRRALKEVRKLAAERSREKRHALIDAKRTGQFITKAEAKWLKRQPPATVDSFLELRKRPILRTHESEYIPDDTGRPDASAHLSDQQMTFIRQAAAQTGVSVEKMVDDYKKGLGRPNGVKQ